MPHMSAVPSPYDLSGLALEASSRDLGTTPPRSVEQRELLAELTATRLTRAHTASKAEADDLRAAVVTSHLWLAASLARRFRGRGEDEEDLLQVARCGLVEAALRHDPSRGPYSPFAASTVLGLLKRHFRDHGWSVRPPRPTQELATGVWRLWPDLAQSEGCAPTDRAIAAELGATVEDVRQARMATEGYRASSLETALFDEGRNVSGATPETDEAECRVLLSAALAALTVDERQLVCWRFFEQRTQSDIAARLGTHQMQVSRLLTRLLVKLRGIIGPLDGLEAA